MQSGIVSTAAPVIPNSGRGMRSIWGRRLAVSVCIVAIFYVLTPILLAWMGRWLNVGEQLAAPVDYVFVLGGDASTRPFLGAAIYRAGYAKTVLIPEGASPPGGDGILIPEHQILIAVLLHRGVPPEDIVQLSGPVDSTRDEALALAEFLKPKPDARVAIVTSDFHTRRTRLIFRRTLPGSQNRLHFIACPTDGFGPDNWWHYRDGILWYSAEFPKLVREFFR